LLPSPFLQERSCRPPLLEGKGRCVFKCPPPPTAPGVFVNNGFYATLQAAIDDVPTGTTLVLQNGIYPETLRIAGKQLQIIGKGAIGDERKVMTPRSGSTPWISVRGEAS
jgi:hypothetical protein